MLLNDYTENEVRDFMGDFGKYGLLFILLENNQCVKIFGVCSGNLL